MATTVEVDGCLERNLCLDIVLCGGRGELLVGGVEGGDVGVVVLAVVELHDLAGDGWLEGAIVVCQPVSRSDMFFETL